MYYKFTYLLYILIFVINIKCYKTFNVNFYYNYNLQVEPFNTQIFKRELTQFFDKASFSLNGFEKVESVPVLFPIDICIFNLEGFKYAAALHMKRNGIRHFVVLKMNNGSYEQIADIPTPNGIAMDCINFNNKGYVAIALNLTEPIKYAKEGSPIYEIAGNHLRPVQYFAAPNLFSVYLRVSGNDFFLLQTYTSSQDAQNLQCPYFKWSGRTFNKLGRIPCSNARHLAPFSIEYESYVAVANYADQRGRTATNSEIYKFSREKKKFVLFQKVKTNGAVDVQYFNVPHNEIKKQHFLVFGNSISSASLIKREKAKREGKNLEADSVFYIFEKGQFIPYQKLSLYAVKKFLPVQNIEAEKFILLVACTDQDIKIYNLNDWKFEESKVQFTEGALGKGVANMRIYQENDKSFLIIANELMADNETNIFLPIFKQDEHANALRQQIIDWAKLETQRLQTFNVKDLRNRLEEKLKHFKQSNKLRNIQHIPNSNINTVTTKSLVYPKLKMSSNYWMALNYVNQALDALELQLKQRQRLKRETDPYENLEYVYETLDVNTLTINDQLKAKYVNKVNVENPEFTNIQAHKVLVTGNYTNPSKERFNLMDGTDYQEENDVMWVRNLQINGKLNEYTWNDLLNNSLKRKAEIQFLKAPIKIENLKTDIIINNNDEVSGQHLGALIPINGGKYVINQDIQFAKPITAKNVNIYERLNNIHVFNGKFDVLLKKSNETQIIEGVKNVTNLKVMEPITIAGKMMGRQLESMSPHKIINDALILQGDFLINGDVIINHQLNTVDFIDLKEKLSVKQVLDTGIRMDKSLEDVKLKFLQPLKANNSLVSFVNQHDLQRLVKLNQDDIQVIEGEKIFNNSLEIRGGFSEVKNLNGVDMEKLERNAFLKNTNQTIKVPMKIGKITTKSVESPSILLNNKNLSAILTKSGNQSTQGSLLVDNLKVQTLIVENLNANSKIFKQHLNDIYQQKSRNAPQEDVFQENRKFHGSIYVQNLILNSTINNKTIEEIENNLLQLEGNIKYVGNFKFNYPMNVTNLTFYGKLNDVKAQEFGKCWLQKIGPQKFTASQTLASIRADNGIQLKGKLNGFTMEDFYTKTYWINRDEYIQNINFENPINIATTLNTETLNYYYVPEDVMFSDSNKYPLALKSLTVEGDVNVKGRLLNITSLNSINLCAVNDYFRDLNLDTLYVENAVFLQGPPLYKTLNHHNIRQTLDNVWLANENVILPQHVEISEAYFEGLLEFEGPINGMNMKFLKENYFSKSKPQEVSVEMVFSEGVECANTVKVYELNVFGPIIEGKSKTSFDFNEFVQNTLKTSGPHIISGNWSILESVIEGNLNQIYINQLNLMDDVVHIIKPIQPYELKAPKLFKNIHIENLYADPLSLVNKVPVADWIKNAVYLYENFTIRGITSIDSLNVYNNVIVLGKLNNVTFNEFTLLLQDKDQYIAGNFKIKSHLAEEKRFLTNNVENLYADYINQQHMPTFMENLIPSNGNAEIQNHLIFKIPLKVEKYEGPEGFLTQNQWIKRDININGASILRDNIDLRDEMYMEFDKVHKYLKNLTKETVYQVDHFEIMQTLNVNASKVILLCLKTEKDIFDILGVFDNQKNNVTFFKLLPENKQFIQSQDFNSLPKDSNLWSIIRNTYGKSGAPIDVGILKKFIKEQLPNGYKPLTNVLKTNSPMVFLNDSCIIFHDNSIKSKELRLQCKNKQNFEVFLKTRQNIEQILNLNNSLALLTNNSIQIYNTTTKIPKLSQKLATINPKQMAWENFNNYRYLAVISHSKPNTLNQGFVEIYRSINDSAFSLHQILQCVEPLQVKFSYIKKSKDLLLLIMTGSLDKPLLIYQYQGILGFQPILSESILPANNIDIQILDIKSSMQQHFVGLLGKNQVTLLEIVLKRIV